jgi:hypothetical protein
MNILNLYNIYDIIMSSDSTLTDETFTPVICSNITDSRYCFVCRNIRYDHFFKDAREAFPSVGFSNKPCCRCAKQYVYAGSMCEFCSMGVDKLGLCLSCIGEVNNITCMNCGCVFPEGNLGRDNTCDNGHTFCSYCSATCTFLSNDKVHCITCLEQYPDSKYLAMRNRSIMEIWLPYICLNPDCRRQVYYECSAVLHTSGLCLPCHYKN